MIFLASLLDLSFQKLELFKVNSNDKHNLTKSVVEHAVLLGGWLLFVLMKEPRIVNAAP